MSKPGKICNKVKNPCKICLRTVTHKTGLQCCGACQSWVHYECCNYTPGKIQDIKRGVITVTCPCPDCETQLPKEYRTDKRQSCANQQCPANRPPKCDNRGCPIYDYEAPPGTPGHHDNMNQVPSSQWPGNKCGADCKKFPHVDDQTSQKPCATPSQQPPPMPVKLPLPKGPKCGRPQCKLHNPQGNAQGMPSDASQATPQTIPCGLSQAMPQGMSQGMPQGMVQGMLQGLSQAMPQGMLQGMSQGMTQQSLPYSSSDKINTAHDCQRPHSAMGGVMGGFMGGPMGGATCCPMGGPMGGPMVGDTGRQQMPGMASFNSQPSFSVVEQMCTTVGLLSKQLNELMCKMKDSVATRVSTQPCLQTGNRENCPKPCHCPENPKNNINIRR